MPLLSNHTRKLRSCMKWYARKQPIHISSFVASTHTPDQVQNLAKKISSDEENPKKKSQGASELAGGEAPSSSSSRSKKTGKVPKARRDGTPKPSSSSGEGGHGKSDSLFMQFARLERDGWNQEVPALRLNRSATLTTRFIPAGCCRRPSKGTQD